MLAPQPLGQGRPSGGAPTGNIRQEAYKQRMQNFSTSSSDRDLANLDAAQALKAMMTSGVSTLSLITMLKF